MQKTPSLITLCGALGALMLMTACATLPPGATRNPRDPLERINRTTFKFDDVLAHKVRCPSRAGYQSVVPNFLRAGHCQHFRECPYARRHGE